MKYEASQELIDIFLRNGFYEVTEKTHPEHHTRLLKNGYDSSFVKRHFAFKKNAPFNGYIKFDYINIEISHDTPQVFNTSIYLDENQLKSIFTFFKMPPLIRRKFKHIGVTKLFEEYQNIKEYSHWRNTSADKKLIEIFDSIVL